MNGEKLMEYIGCVDDELIIEAERNVPRIRRSQWVKIGAVAASIAAAVVLIVMVSQPFFVDPIILPGEPNENISGIAPTPSPAPLLDMSGVIGAFSDGMGMQAFQATDLAQIIGNPPRIEDMQLRMLPVFRSPIHSLDGWRQTPIDTPDTTAMFERIERIAGFFGLPIEYADNIVFETIEDIVHNDHNFELFEKFYNWPFSATVYWGDLSIQMSNTDLPHQAIIRMPIDSFPMPPGINERFESYFTTYNVTDEQALLMTEYFLEYFAPLVGMFIPVADIVSGYIFPPEEFMRIHFWHSFSAYESVGNYVERVLGYNFNRIRFVPGIETQDDYIYPHNFARIEIDRPDFMLSQKIGNYRIISLEEARQKLIQGYYITTVFTDRPPAEEFIAHVDLVYLTHWQEIFMPFYRFKVELPVSPYFWDGILEYAAAEHGMKTYGWYFVPAVRPEYLMEWPPVDNFFQ